MWVSVSGVQPKGFHPLISAVIDSSRCGRACRKRLTSIFDLATCTHPHRHVQFAADVRSGYGWVVSIARLNVTSDSGTSPERSEETS